MKILDAHAVPPKPKEAWPFDSSPVECPHCHSQIAFEEHDKKNHTITTSTNRTTGITEGRFTCPVCNESVMVRHIPATYAAVSRDAELAGFKPLGGRVLH